MSAPIRLEVLLFSALGGGPAIVLRLPGGDQVSLLADGEPLGLRLSFEVARRLGVAPGLLLLNTLCMAGRDLRCAYYRRCVAAGYSLAGLSPEARAEAEGASQ